QLFSQVSRTECRSRKMAETVGRSPVAGNRNEPDLQSPALATFTVLGSFVVLHAFYWVWWCAHFFARVVAFFVLQRALWIRNASRLLCVYRIGNAFHGGLSPEQHRQASPQNRSLHFRGRQLLVGLARKA